MDCGRTSGPLSAAEQPVSSWTPALDINNLAVAAAGFRTVAGPGGVLGGALNNGPAVAALRRL